MKKLPLLLAALVAALLCRQASAATFTIADGDVAGLIAAINTANANNEDDTINLAANGHYANPVGINYTNGENGMPVIGADNGHTLTINGNGATIQGSVGFLNFRIFYIGSGADVTFSGLTIANAQGEQGYDGSGIYNDHGTLAVKNCTFSQNSAREGGAIFNDGSFDGSGSATLTITNSTFSHNSAHDGGAITNDGNYSGSAPTSITNSTFSQNSAYFGGGIYNEDATLTVTNSTFSQNSASSEGDGIYNDGEYDGATLQIGNTIINTDAPTENIANNYGTVISLGYNLINDGGVTNGNGGTGDLNATGDQTNTDPLLDPAGLKDNGGPTQTIALQSGSPAIDKGKDMDENGDPTGVDQRGFTRPIVTSGITAPSGGDHSDIGAFELSATYRSEKQDARALVQGLIPSGDSKADKELQKAVDHLARSLDPVLWVDDFHLGRRGDKVFNEEKQAVLSLQKVIATVPRLAARSRDAINQLVKVDREIAQLAIDEAVAGGDPREIAKANAEMAQAQQALANGHPDAAIEHFGKAWQSAMKARR